MINRFRKEILIGMFSIFLVLCCMQMLVCYSFGSFALKWYHVFSLVFLPFLIHKKKIEFPNKIIMFSFLYILTISVINIATYSINSLLLNYIFMLYIIIILINLASDFTVDDLKKVFQYAATALMIMVWIKNMGQIDAFVTYLTYKTGHPWITTLFGGGVNLEASWLGILGFAFDDKKKGLIYNMICLLTSLLYGSRAALMINLIWIVWYLIKLVRDREKIQLFIFSMLLFAILAVAMKIGALEYMISRFVNSSSEAGTQGRLAMWEFVGDAMLQTPFGCGIGNSIACIERVSGQAYWEDNLHNVYLQMFVDLGWFGGIAYFGLVAGFGFYELKNWLTNPFVAMLYAYIVASLVQFRGGDAIIAFAIGAYFVVNKRRKQLDDEALRKDLGNYTSL